ncbi:MAG: hypothetical protein HRT35_16740 [Algicola sp.]|nr:hypothetical protein [Algicola sp.]
MFKPLALLLTLGLFCHDALAEQSAITVDAKERQAVVEKVSTLMINNYVSEAVARETAAHIQKQLKNGAYDNITQGEAFAAKLTEDVQSINHDKHMRIRVQHPRPAPASSHAKTEPESPLVHVFRNQQHNRQRNNGHQKVEVLDGNVGYIDFRMFGGSDAAKQKAATALAYLEDTDAMIIDLRKNGGGSPDTVRFICSYFFGEKTHLNSLYWRQGNRTEEFWTLDEIPGKRRPDVPLYILTSDYTFSGAEEFSYNMQTRKRAILVGETTGGGANPGGRMPINKHFNINMPRGMAINPVTGTNWEGVGVKPEVAVDESQALDKAYELAKVAAQQFRQKNLDKQIKNIDELEKQLAKAARLVKDKQADKAQNLINRAMSKAMDSGLGGENEVNMLGYSFLEQQSNPAMAVLVFSFNTLRFPDSSNAFDSLGEAYLMAGNDKLAKKSYLKSLALDPQNDNAKSMLKGL